jgi:hypothetical protein
MSIGYRYCGRHLLPHHDELRDARSGGVEWLSAAALSVMEYGEIA